MKRMIGMVAAMALATSTAAYGQNTLTEIHQYFTVGNAAAFGGAGAGGLTTSAPDRTANPRITAAPGDMVFLAVWVRALQGNSAGPIAVTSYNYEIGGAGVNALTHFSNGGTRQRSLGGSYADTPGTPTPAVPVPYNDGMAGPTNPLVTQMWGLSGANSGAGANAEINSGAAGDSAGAFMVQIIKVQVAASAVAGDELDLYFTTPKTGGATYATSGGIGSLTTVAYGANAAGALDQKRISNTTADIVGTLNDRVSTTPDAVIVVPEPGTLGLLALGLLGLRRRRS